MKKKIWIPVILGVLSLSLLAFRAGDNKYFEIAKNLEIFTSIYKELNTSFVDDVDPGKLMRIGIDAMMKSCDPYTVYWSESEMEGYRFLTEGKYSGIGASFRKNKTDIVLTEIYEESPASKAGLKVGDRILFVNGFDTKGKGTDELGALLLGVPGTKLTMKVRRPGIADSLKEVTIVREEIETQNVPYSGMLDRHVGYVALNTFTNQAGNNIANALRNLKGQDAAMTGVILDLRGNGGGLLSEAINLCNVFLPRNTLIVTTRGKVEELNQTFKSTNASVDETIPLVVLIDKMSASASEIVSGTIQDYDRGVLIGQRSYGKGLVQNTKDIGYNSKMKLTTSKYYISSGRCIQAVAYQNGEPVDIPESQRTPFKTKAGRMVTDGGGVKPDILVDPHRSSSVLKALDENLVIFDYVTLWCDKKGNPGSLDAFHFTEWEDFLHYLKQNDFSFRTETETALETLRMKAVTENYHGLIESQITAVHNQIEVQKTQELEKFKSDIINMIEREIASRYAGRNGSVKMALRNDEEVSLAIDVLNDPARYKKLLSK